MENLTTLVTRIFSRLFRSQITSRTNGSIHFCKKCFTHFTKQNLLEKHIIYSSTNETVAVKMPRRKTFLKFENHYKQFPMPVVIYADFECFTKPVYTCTPNPNQSYTCEYQKHEPSGFCLCLKGLGGLNQFIPVTYTKRNEMKKKIFQKYFNKT